MLEVIATYQNGKVEFSENIQIPSGPVKIIVTFLEDVKYSLPKPLRPSDFSFSKSRELLKKYKGSFSEEVISERREML